MFQGAGLTGVYRHAIIWDAMANKTLRSPRQFDRIIRTIRVERGLYRPRHHLSVIPGQKPIHIELNSVTDIDRWGRRPMLLMYVSLY